MFFVEPARFNISPLPSRLALRTSGCAPPCRASASETLAAVHREPRARSASRVRAPDDGLPDLGPTSVTDSGTDARAKRAAHKLAHRATDIATGLGTDANPDGRAHGDAIIAADRTGLNEHVP